MLRRLRGANPSNLYLRPVNFDGTGVAAADSMVTIDYAMGMVSKKMPRPSAALDEQDARRMEDWTAG